MRYRLVATCHSPKPCHETENPDSIGLARSSRTVIFGLAARYGRWPRPVSAEVVGQGNRIQRMLVRRAVAELPAAGALFVGNTHFLDYAGIFGELFARHGAEFLRRTAAHRKTQFLELSPRLGVANGFANLGVESRDD